MVFAAQGLIPARFLTLIGHMTMSIIILWAKDENIKACLPYEYTNDEYSQKDLQLTIGLSVALGLIGLELLGFLSGVTMFMPTAAICSIAAHSSASVLLAYFLFDEWDCNLYWLVFALCSVLPAVVELIVAFGVLVLKKV